MDVRNLTFHVGLHKTGTTFLQAEVFPRLDGITYIRWRNLEYLLRLDESTRYLISSEGLSGRTLASLDERLRGLERLALMFPGARVIIGVRRHGDFLASLYSQYLRYGGKETFSGFLDPNRRLDRFPFSRKEVSFRAIVATAWDAFKTPPFVYDMADMFREPEKFLAEFCAYTGASASGATNAFDSPSRNAGLRGWQGNLLRRVNERASVHLSLDGRDRPYRRLRRWHIDPPTIFRRWLGGLPSKPLVSRAMRQQIDDDPTLTEDWNWIRSYVEQRAWSKELP